MHHDVDKLLWALQSEEVTEHAAFELLPPPSPLHLSSAPPLGLRKKRRANADRLDYGGIPKGESELRGTT